MRRQHQIGTADDSVAGLGTVAVAIVAAILPVFLMGSLSVEIRHELGTLGHADRSLGAHEETHDARPTVTLDASRRELGQSAISQDSGRRCVARLDELGEDDATHGVAAVAALRNQTSVFRRSEGDVERSEDAAPWVAGAASRAALGGLSDLAWHAGRVSCVPLRQWGDGG